MFKLIVGLGNPGRKYARTRHNVGFWFVEDLAAELGVTWAHQSRFQGHIASTQIAGQKVILLKPDTFMNRSGLSVGKVARYYGIESGEVLVIHDELDFDVGVVKLKKSGGHAGHNGLRDIIAHLGGKDFYRLRIGIARPASKNLNVADYVLSEPSKADRALIDQAMNAALASKDVLFSGQVDQFMNNLH